MTYTSTTERERLHAHLVLHHDTWMSPSEDYDEMTSRHAEYHEQGAGHVIGVHSASELFGQPRERSA